MPPSIPAELAAVVCDERTDLDAECLVEPQYATIEQIGDGDQDLRRLDLDAGGSSSGTRREVRIPAIVTGRSVFT